MKVNPEGLTFEEWVCAAGVAAFTYDGRVKPYSKSTTTYRSIARPRSPHLVLCFGTSRPTGPVKVVRIKRINYSKKIRNAWIAGEDPTEWRA